MADQNETLSGRVSGNEEQSSEVLARYLPPHNVEAEQSVLGAMLLETAAVEKAGETLTPEDFYRETHQVLFEAILAINARNQPVDLITLQNELRTRDKLAAVGGIGYLTALFDAVPSAAHVEHYAKIVEEKAMLRKLIDAAMQIVGMARSPEPDQEVSDLIDQSERLVFNVARRRMDQYFSPLSPLLVTVYDRAEELGQLKAEVSGLPTGFKQLNMWTAGLQKADMIIVAARPSMGKTSLCLTIAQHVALREKKTVAIFSLEMSKEQLALRMLCSEALVSSHRVRTGHLNDAEWASLAESVDKMYDAPIYIDDATETSSLTMRAKCRRLAAEHGLSLIIVDYLQLMRSHRKTENRVQEIGEIARGLKSLAREMQVPVIALSQLSRAVETRDNKRPMLSDLRESGSIEAEADLVCFLYRDAYYKQKEARDAGEFFEKPESETIEETELIIGKHRNGPTGTVKIGFMPDYAKFVDVELQHDDSGE
ncbi:MAG: replicative DNA helicase [Capsulimonadaceae bacterium]|nr:replicative DNA helicase [Capsulimonadaceae bacterium]